MDFIGITRLRPFGQDSHPLRVPAHVCKLFASRTEDQGKISFSSPRRHRGHGELKNCHPEALCWTKDLSECIGLPRYILAFRPELLGQRAGTVRRVGRIAGDPSANTSLRMTILNARFRNKFSPCLRGELGSCYSFCFPRSPAGFSCVLS